MPNLSLDHKEGWMLKNWYFRTVVLEKTLESPLDCKEIKPVHLKGNQPWIPIGGTDAKAEAAILWPPDAKNWLIGKDPDSGKDWRQEEKGMIEDLVVGWNHRLNGHKFEQAPGDGEGQGSQACYSPWGCKELDTTEWLNNNNNFSLINWKMGIWEFKGFNEIKYIHACSVESYSLRAWEDPLEKEMASYSSIFAWKIPWMEEPAKLPSMGLQCHTQLSNFTSLHFATPWTAAHQTLSVESPTQEYCSGLPLPSPGDFPNPGIKTMSPVSPALAGEFFISATTWEAHSLMSYSICQHLRHKVST